MEKTHTRETMLFKIILVVVGFLVGLGAAHITTMATVATHDVKIDMMEKSIETNAETIQKTLDLVKAAVDQNSILIYKVVGKTP